VNAELVDILTAIEAGEESLGVVWAIAAEYGSRYGHGESETKGVRGV
jgi:hypothetical protein